MRDAGPAVDDPDHQLLPDHARAHRDPLGARVAHRVLEQVRERALELSLVRADERKVRVDGERRTRVPPGPAPVGRLTEDLVDRAPLRAAARRRRPEAARDPAASPPARVSRSASSMIARPRSTRSAARDLALDQRRAGGHDRRQRRAQVVGDGAQQRRLELVAAAQRTRLDHLGLQRGRAPGRPRAAPRAPAPRARADARAWPSRRPADDQSADPVLTRRSSSSTRRRRHPARGVELDRRRTSRPSASASRRDASPRASTTPAPPSRIRARSAARSASCRRCSASLARERASSATALATTAATRKTASATQLPAVGDREAARSAAGGRS